MASWSPMNGLVEPMNGLVEPMNGLVEPMNGLAEPMNGLVVPIDGLVEPMNGLLDAMNGLVEPMHGPAEPVNGLRGSVNALPVSTAIQLSLGRPAKNPPLCDQRISIVARLQIFFDPLLAPTARKGNIFGQQPALRRERNAPSVAYRLLFFSG